MNEYRFWYLPFPDPIGCEAPQNGGDKVKILYHWDNDGPQRTFHELQQVVCTCMGCLFLFFFLHARIYYNYA
jgi:hypothetical protein